MRPTMIHTIAQQACVAAGAVAAAVPFNEARRIHALRGYGVLDTASEQAYDDLTKLASVICRAPIALISLIDVERQWFKSRIGLELSETSREMAFCAHAILAPDETLVVPDATLDRRFAGNPLVTGEAHIRFYAGAPLVTPEGLALGTVCVLDRMPRRLADAEREALESLARQVVAQLELRQALAELEVESVTDGLTSLWNRRYFDRRLPEEWMRHSRSASPLSLLFVDLDHFKRVNDTHGHPAGDAVLRRTAEVLRAQVRSSDVVTRFGGEEFAILLPETSLASALLVAEKIRAALQRADSLQGAVTASIGVTAVVPDRKGNPHSLVAQADQALYRAKEMGRNQSQSFASWA